MDAAPVSLCADVPLLFLAAADGSSSFRREAAVVAARKARDMLIRCMFFFFSIFRSVPGPDTGSGSVFQLQTFAFPVSFGLLFGLSARALITLQ